MVISCLGLSYIVVFLCLVILYFDDLVAVDLLLCYLGLLCCFIYFFSPGFDFDFLSTSQEEEIGPEERPRNDLLFLSSWTLNLKLSQ